MFVARVIAKLHMYKNHCSLEYSRKQEDGYYNSCLELYNTEQKDSTIHVCNQRHGWSYSRKTMAYKGLQLEYKAGRAVEQRERGYYNSGLEELRKCGRMILQSVAWS